MMLSGFRSVCFNFEKHSDESLRARLPLRGLYT
jgi:hypothetical protein